jgi:hypothetical protein
VAVSSFLQPVTCYVLQQANEIAWHEGSGASLGNMRERTNAKSGVAVIH